MGDDYRKLVRSKSNRTICGVCGGIGEYLHVDPTLVRLIWLLCSLGSCGTGLIITLWQRWLFRRMILSSAKIQIKQISGECPERTFS